ncbi:glycosyl hydrolase family 28 protein [Paenibacillus sp. J5C_2022]|uniref:glycosyl hydrolase family 28 protein n=1 Tax=Paenibacillus sp. J5C2022 TaxID=2977129 RepID=UPI0021D119C9|nr:glycosyl hydrolase family 28 protein [Paenibacillus sp. J5C2022]MCU6707358.1 glycosyl hydrolase family 28 protein [Paenibacillus sp. J5C2022]
MSDPFLYTIDNVQLRIFPAPEEIGFAAAEARLAVQGNDAYGADPDGLVLSRDWQLSAGGHEIPVYAVPVTSGGPLSFASFEYVAGTEAVVLKAKSKRPVHRAQIRPVVLGVVAEVLEDEVRIPIRGPGKYIVETNDEMERPLFIMVHASEENVPAAGNANVIYYGPGLHVVSTLELYSGQTVYIAGGAVLRVMVPEGEVPDVESDWAGKKLYRDTFVAQHAADIAIRGRGIVDLSMLDWHARKAALVQNCERVRIEGITCVGTSHWTIHLSQSKDCIIRDLMLIGYRENSDGIDIVNSERVRVDNCLIRTGDDAVVVKAMAAPPALGGRDIRVYNCTVWNDKVRCFGITGETRTDISGVVFENCDVVHSRAIWTEELGSLCIIVGDSGTIDNIRFENMRIEDEQRYAMVCLIFKDRWSVDQAAGRIRNIVFRNIQIPEGVPSLFHGFDNRHLVEQVVVEGLFVDGQPVEHIAQANFCMNNFVNNIYVSSGSEVR